MELNFVQNTSSYSENVATPMMLHLDFARMCNQESSNCELDQNSERLWISS